MIRSTPRPTPLFGRLAATTALLVLPLAAVAQSGGTPNGAAGMTGMAGMAGMSMGAETGKAGAHDAHTASPAGRQMAVAMQKMDRDMAAAPMNGDPDHDFVSMMKPHHQGAVEMAEIQLKYGRDPEIRKMAREIIASQKKEIAEMDAWLARHK